LSLCSADATHGLKAVRVVPVPEMSTLDRVAHAVAVSVPAGLLLVGSAVPLPVDRNPDFGPLGPDKFLHLVGHAWLTAALVRAIDADGHDPGRAAALAVVLSVGYGLATERLQEAVPGREFEWPDVVAGLLGSVLGVLAGRRRPRGT
jgi:VanZ family protein